MIRRPPRSTQSRSSAASDVYKRQVLPDALLAEAAATTLLSAAQEVEQCTSDLTTLRGEEDDVRTISKGVEAAYEAARHSWLSSLASTVASELVDHFPCPVCGSEDHPQSRT